MSSIPRFGWWKLFVAGVFYILVLGAVGNFWITDNGEKAAMFALIAATAFIVNAVRIEKARWIDLILDVVAFGAPFGAAWFWMLSEADDSISRLAIVHMAAVATIVAITAFYYYRELLPAWVARNVPGARVNDKR